MAPHQAEPTLRLFPQRMRVAILIVPEYRKARCASPMGSYAAHHKPRQPSRHGSTQPPSLPVRRYNNNKRSPVPASSFSKTRRCARFCHRRSPQTQREPDCLPALISQEVPYSLREPMKLAGLGGSGRHDDVNLTAQSHLEALSRDVRSRTMFFTLTPLVGAKD
jgi:hypothetical protein